ncbi:hypothetical protein EDC01DRAFT_28582 [Geopyxis carbonaria]|nr:hypothetical protein EDC01DRAFT_28582 [Geopyxis carbonaria]
MTTVDPWAQPCRLMEYSTAAAARRKFALPASCRRCCVVVEGSRPLWASARRVWWSWARSWSWARRRTPHSVMHCSSCTVVPGLALIRRPPRPHRLSQLTKPSSTSHPYVAPENPAKTMARAQIVRADNVARRNGWMDGWWMGDSGREVYPARPTRAASCGAMGALELATLAKPQFLPARVDEHAIHPSSAGSGSVPVFQSIAIPRRPQSLRRRVHCAALSGPALRTPDQDPVHACHG